MAWFRWYLFFECLDLCKLLLLTVTTLCLVTETVTGQAPSTTEREAGSPSFVDTRREIKVLQSGMAVLPCSVRNLGDRQVVWRRLKDDKFLTIGAMVWTKDHRVIVDFDVDDEGTTTWDLIIRNVQFSDIGAYECQITSIEFLTRNVELFVFEKPTLKSKSTLLKPTTLTPTSGTKLSSADHKYLTHQQEIVTSGLPIRMTCNTSLGNHSLPTSSLEWFKDDTNVHSNNHVLLTRYQFETDRMYVSELIIDSSTVSDTGEYKCRLGEEVLYVFKILVLPKTKTRSRKDHANAHFYATNVNVMKSSEDKRGTGSGAIPSGNNVLVCLLVCVCQMVLSSSWSSSLVLSTSRRTSPGCALG